jgi:hypothetical protein
MNRKLYRSDGRERKNQNLLFRYCCSTRLGKIINELMKVVNIVAIIVFVVALGLQVLNFVSQTKS